tara:strand:- start:112 stop:2034 length:1923 start_codon:yes stop_codon:yes gene_type:complete
MLYKIKLILFLLFIGNFLFSDSIRYNTPNNHGSIGLINTPSARFYSESSSAFTLYRGNPDRKLTITMMPYDWFEGSFFYTSIKDKPYGSGFTQDYKDKGFNVKFRLKSEGNFPAIAIGFNDLAGTGLYSSEYLVSSYGINNLDMHLGIGWGVLSGGGLQNKNFLSHFDESFLLRDSDIGEGGKLNLDNYFSGKDTGIFGGISYVFSDDILFKFEYDSTEMPVDQGFPISSSDYSAAIEYVGNDNFNIGLSYERGDYLGIKFAFKNNSSKYNSTPYKKRENNSLDRYENLRLILNRNDIGVNKIEKKEDTLRLEISEYSYSDIKILNANIQQAIIDSGLDQEEIIISYKTAGLDVKNKPLKIDDQAKKIYSKKYKRSFNYSPEFVLRPFIAGREDFLKVAFMAEINAQYIITDQLFWTTNLKYPLWQNFDDLYIPPVNTYPNQVRSDIKDYLSNFKNRLILGRSQLDFFKTISENHHLHFSAGIFEEMFGGYGMEYLWNRNDLPFSIGFEVFEAYKRDYDLAFNFLNYSNTTSHINFYYENNTILPFSLHLSYGEYLAGDKGYTFDISRNFDNGVTMGAFFTKTDVTAEQFGEGSFDKGIYFQIPISDEWFKFKWRPLTKDPGAKLVRKDRLYDFLRKYKD